MAESIEMTLPPAGAESRLMVFPDGITRHITLSAWEWRVFDATPHSVLLPEAAYLHAMTFWVLYAFNHASSSTDRRGSEGQTEAVPHGARERRGFEARLRRSLSRLIAANMRSVTGGAPPVNDEF